MELRECRVCHKPKPISSFGKASHGSRRRQCEYCRGLKKQENDVERHLAKKRRQSSNYRITNPVATIVNDCKASDKKKGRGENDLDRAFVEELIRNGCSYCGDDQLRMTLDRMDNSKPHTRENVVPSCIRCNYIRGSMPYTAWLNMVPAVRSTRELGLFGDWRSRPMVDNGRTPMYTVDAGKMGMAPNQKVNLVP